MIKKALVLLPPGTERTDDAVSPLTRLGGLTLIQRILYSLQWAGIEKGVLLPIVSPEIYFPQANEDILDMGSSILIG